MQFALIDDKRMKPASNLKGICPICKQPVISKCGNQRIHHWAHKSVALCDSWKENETEWHRLWKNKFPDDWQEVIHHDPKTNEKHIADVKTAGGMVVEFQHSHIDPKERQSREDFYKKMVWVVDGTRLSSNLSNFEKARKEFRNFKANRILRTVENYEKVFPKDWLESKVPVFIDFLGMNPLEDSWKKYLICIFPNRINGRIVFFLCDREKFIQCCIEEKLINELEIIYSKLFPAPPKQYLLYPLQIRINNKYYRRNNNRINTMIDDPDFTMKPERTKRWFDRRGKGKRFPLYGRKKRL